MSKTSFVIPALEAEHVERLAEGRHHDPFSVLGKHSQGGDTVIRVYSPFTESLWLDDLDEEMHRQEGTDLFLWKGKSSRLQGHHRLRKLDDQGQQTVFHDPYSFSTILEDFDLDLFSAGSHLHVWRILGSHFQKTEGVPGTRFAVWAPNAERVSVIGDFNRWDGRCHPMRNRGQSGVWELFIPGVDPGALYKYEIRNRDTGDVLSKYDPYAQRSELRPRTASEVFECCYQWRDQEWLDNRTSHDWLHQPMSIYEVHLGSWQKHGNGEFLSYRDLAHKLVGYVKALGFTHIELLPVTEHPFDDSWGYQATGYFSPTSRFGSPDDFRYFVDHCHLNGIGVLLDWVPAHFPKDEFALARFDGSTLYEHEDPRLGEHPDWGTLIFNYGRNEVRNFLISSALFWLQEYHIDGLRVDAVASMLYLDYSREEGQWLPNRHGGNENIEAISFFRDLNRVTHTEAPGTVIIAEESTAWPQVTRPTDIGGLGFSMKWNMGWMHDTLDYFSHEAVHRSYHHDQLTFGLLYLFSENFVLPFSHDEVVHGKGSLLDRMPGDEWQKFANLRLLFTYMFTYPGKKLLFMGCEFGQGREWNSKEQLEWYVLDYPHHSGLQKLVSDLNHFYRSESALYSHDFDHQGFEWIDCHDNQQSVISYVRKDGDKFVLVILNFTPVPRHDYRVGVPVAGKYTEVLNSDSGYYNGSNIGNFGELYSTGQSAMGRPDSVVLTLPPLAAVVLKISGNDE